MKDFTTPPRNVSTDILAEQPAPRARVVAAVCLDPGRSSATPIPPEWDVFQDCGAARKALETHGYEVAVVASELRGGYAFVDGAVDQCLPVIVIASAQTSRERILDLLRSGALSCLGADELHVLPSLLEELDTARRWGIPGLFEHARDRVQAVLGEEPRHSRVEAYWEGDLFTAVAEGARKRVLKHLVLRCRARWREWFSRTASQGTSVLRKSVPFGPDALEGDTNAPRANL
jgi:hypothetical protein